MQIVPAIAATLFRTTQHDAIHAGIFGAKRLIKRIGHVVGGDTGILDAVDIVGRVTIAGGDEVRFAVERPIQHHLFPFRLCLEEGNQQMQPERMVGT